MSNSALYLSLPNMSTTYMEIINKINDMVDDGSASSYLPEIHRSDPRMISGYKHQLTVLANFFANPKAPSFETAFATGTSLSAIHLHPLSRGTVRLDLKQPLEIPIIDYRAGSNPVDFDIHIAHVRYLRRLNSTDTMLKYGAFETPPLQSVQDDYASLLKYVKDTMVFSYMHPCCTAAMMPEEKGGVVGPDLKVHGVEGLRVVDMSVLPLLPSSHLSSTAYAVGEKVSPPLSGLLDENEN
jgi:choline dehydrogenase-like flavoprotein